MITDLKRRGLLDSARLRYVDMRIGRMPILEARNGTGITIRDDDSDDHLHGTVWKPEAASRSRNGRSRLQSLPIQS